MNAQVIISKTDSLLKFSGKVVRVIPKIESPKLVFSMNTRKGCGPVVDKRAQ